MKEKKCVDLANTSFVNEVATKLSEEKKHHQHLMKKGHFDHAAEEIRILRSIDPSAKVSKAMIDFRIQRKYLFFL